MSKAKGIKRSMKKCIDEIASLSAQYTQNPDVDFTRNRKLSFSEVMKAILCFSGKSLNKELIEIFGYGKDTATVSAFVQQRSKIKGTAFEDLFHSFTEQNEKIKLFNGYRLLAFDGSAVNTPSNPEDKASCFKVKNCAAYNLYYLNALYDLLSNTYVDALIQNKLDYGEDRALIDMAKRSNRTQKTIFIADRGLESFNIMANIQELGHYFIIRFKDINSNGIAKGLQLQNYGDTFDANINLNLTRKNTNEAKKLCMDNPDFKYIHSSTKFDFLPEKSKKSEPLVFFNLSFRLVRFEISEGNYELLATNLDSDEFSVDALKQLYALRWGIETSFRHLKYTLALNNFHSVKSENIIQEIFAKLTMYNFTQMITSHIVISKAKRKYIYKINFSVAVHICRDLFLGICSPTVAEAEIQKRILPFRPDLHKPRNRHTKAFVSFSYRLA